ncbi:hypothetical protein IGI04_011108 [Brassica rapa subsp. trilocularis]|uniref:Uncharacterized protein n=1 Tax=Brassica rapa subsp. trilocularis TaxID=1813537 RepID=A0ABQ7N233_BRACM|nr:hypothetical protein IGI04_011108 [Brassica rapa subsp. trilocularis]
MFFTVPYLTWVEPDLAWVVKKPKTDMHSHPADHPDSPASVLIFTPSAICFSVHIQHPAKVILPDFGSIKWYQSHFGWMFGLLKKSKPQQDVYFPFKTVFEKEQLICDKKQFASNEFDFVQKQKKRQNRCDDEKWVHVFHRAILDLGRARLSFGGEKTKDGHAFSSGGPSGQSRKRPYLYPVHPSGSDESRHLDWSSPFSIVGISRAIPHLLTILSIHLSSRSAICFSVHIQHPAKVILPDFGSITFDPTETKLPREDTGGSDRTMTKRFLELSFRWRM